MPTEMAKKGLGRPGDYNYQQYSTTFKRQLSTSGGAGDNGILGDTGLGLVKGQLYTTNTGGEILGLAPTITKAGGVPDETNFINWRRGVFQALDNVLKNSGTKLAQFMTSGSRVYLPAKTTVTVGDQVGLGYKTTTTGVANTYAIDNQVQPVPASATNKLGTNIQYTLGKVTDIMSGDTLNETFQVQNDGDLVIVELI